MSWLTRLFSKKEKSKEKKIVMKDRDYHPSSKEMPSYRRTPLGDRVDDKYYASSPVRDYDPADPTDLINPANPLNAINPLSPYYQGGDDNYSKRVEESSRSDDRNYDPVPTQDHDYTTPHYHSNDNYTHDTTDHSHNDHNSYDSPSNDNSYSNDTTDYSTPSSD